MHLIFACIVFLTPLPALLTLGLIVFSFEFKARSNTVQFFDSTMKIPCQVICPLLRILFIVLGAVLLYIECGGYSSGSDLGPASASSGKDRLKPSALVVYSNQVASDFCDPSTTLPCIFSRKHHGSGKG